MPEIPKDPAAVERSMANCPRPVLKARCLNLLVRNFPRRLVPGRHPELASKVVSALLFFGKELQEDSEIRWPDGARFGQADEGDIRRISQHEEALPETFYLNRAAGGERCYYLEVSGKLVSYNWINFRHCGTYLGTGRDIIFLPLYGGTEAYSHDFYTYLEFRGRGYAKLLKRAMLRDLFKSGTRMLYSCVRPNTFSSLATHLGLGFRLLDVVYLYRLMNWSHHLWAGERKTAEVRQWLEALPIYDNRN